MILSRLLASIVLTGALLCCACTENVPVPDTTDTLVNTGVHNEATPLAEPTTKKPEKKPYRRESQQLQGKDPFKK